MCKPSIVWDLNGVLFKSLKLDSDTLKIVEELNELGFNQYICTNTLKWKLDEWIKECSLNDYFKYIFSISEMGLLKSDPVVYRVVQEYIGSSNILFIDDSEINLEAAKSVGIETLLYTCDKQLKKDLKLLNILND